ncbi:NADP-dependent phosphogluconate dehydrogenase [Ekhidna sp.]
MSKSSFGLIGLGVMGRSLAQNILRNKFSLSVYNRDTPEEAHVLTSFLEHNASEILHGFTSLKEFVESLDSPRKILLMVSAGAPVDDVIGKLLPLLEEKDIVIDGGNSHYQDTEKRNERLGEKQIQYLGCGISGGEEGALKGPSIMPGGVEEAYKEVSGVLEAIAAKDKDGKACCSYVGSGGSGNFVKTIHNGIEYAEMQLIAECYHSLSLHKSNEEIAEIFERWNRTDLSSYLLEITIEILRKKEGDKYLLDLILDKAANKGTGSWSSQISLGNGMPTTMMTDAVFARYISTLKEKRVVLFKIVNRKTSSKDIDEVIVEDAYRFARLVNHQQGFSLVKKISDTNEWHVDLSEIARVWTNGCIIRSQLMEELVSLFRDIENIFDSKDMIARLSKLENGVASYLETSVRAKISTPVISSAYQYWLGMITDRLPANLIQAQRDFFGAHTYERIDSESGKFFHTNW